LFLCGLDLHVYQRQIDHALDDLAVRHAAERRVADHHAHQRRLLQTTNVDAMAAVRRAHTLYFDVPHGRLERAGFVHVAKIDFDRRELHVADFDVARINAVDEPAARAIRLQAEATLEVEAVELVLLREDVARAAAHLTTDGDSAVTCFH